MADVITRLKVESTQFDSKVKRASQELLNLEKTLNGTGKSFATADKSTVQMARDLGKMETVSRTTKGKINELSNAFVELSAQYSRLSDKEKQSPFGKALSKSLDDLKSRVKNAKSELAGFQSELSGTTKQGGNLGGLVDGLAAKFGMSASTFTGVGAAVAGVGAAFKLASDNVALAMNFEKSMSMLSSLTGKTGKDLETLKEYAIELGSTSTLTASQVADAFRLIGSQQPQLLESSQALKDVTKNAITLSEAAGIDLATASQTLSTSINQMGGDSSNAARFVNVLAAASQKGAGDIAWLGEAITKSGTTAKMVGTSYEELVANLEQLAQAGFDASTAGTALRSIIVNLEKKGTNDLKPSVVGLTEAFENLGKKHLTVAEMSELVGKMFGAQAAVLADNATKAKELQTAITGTNTAEEQAKTNTDNLDGALKSLSSAWEGLNLHVNSSNGALKQFIDWCASAIRMVDSLGTAAGRAQLAMSKLGGSGKVDKQISYLGGSNYKDAVYKNTVANYNKDILKLQNEMNKLPQGPIVNLMPHEQAKRKTLQAAIDATVKMRDDYITRAKQVISGKQPAKVEVPVEMEPTSGGGGGKGGKGKKTGGKTGVANVVTEEQQISKTIQALTTEYISASEERRAAIKSEIQVLQQRNEEIKKLKDEALGKTYTPVVDVKQQAQGVSVMGGLPNIGEGLISVMSPLEAMNQKAEYLADQMKNAASPEQWEILNNELQKVKANIEEFKGNGASKTQARDAQDMQKSWQAAAGAISSVGSALQQVEDPAAKVMGIIAQAIANVALGFAQATAAPATTSAGVFGWIAAAVAGTATMISTIASIKSATSGNFAEGGIIPGNSYSGDNVRAYGLNSGELILSKSQQNSIADQLQGGGLGNLQLSAVIDAEQIRMVLNNRGRRTGRGEYIQSRFR